MPYEIVKGEKVNIQTWAPIATVESGALDQSRNVTKLPWVFHHVALMPDVHAGRGCTIGSVIATKEAISPSTVGVDIGCGMGAIQTNLHANELPFNLNDIYHEIERAIPVGFYSHKETPKVKNLALQNQIAKLMGNFDNLTPAIAKRLFPRASQQLGTLGGGNHFIEICLDHSKNVWLTLHSGSRNVGKELAEIHIARAKLLAHNQDLPDRELAVFLANTPEMASYRHDLFWAQQYAMINRKIMMELLLNSLKGFFPHLQTVFEVWCHHNYVSEEVHFGENVFVTRKGAISAQNGEFGLIPGSMGTASYIVRGLGNPESFCSASHGAGRKMSRTKAKQRFTVDDLKQQTKGITCRTDKGVLDEIPGAYKDIGEVMKNQSDLVEIVTELHQILNIKG